MMSSRDNNSQTSQLPVSEREDVIAYIDLHKQLNLTYRNWWASSKVVSILRSMESIFHNFDEEERDYVCQFQPQVG